MGDEKTKKYKSSEGRDSGSNSTPAALARALVRSASSSYFRTVRNSIVFRPQGIDYMAAAKVQALAGKSYYSSGHGFIVEIIGK